MNNPANETLSDTSSLFIVSRPELHFLTMARALLYPPKSELLLHSAFKSIAECKKGNIAGITCLWGKTGEGACIFVRKGLQTGKKRK
jgi:hypothetical protein